MNRRELLLAAASLFVLAPGEAIPQEGRRWRVGWISTDRTLGSPFFEAFRGGLRDLGYVEGKNLEIDARWQAAQIADLVNSRPDVIVTQGGTTFALVRARPASPVVFGYSGDPVEAGFAASLGRPGRNFTGMSFLSLELVGKRLELLKELMPSLKRVGIIANPQHPGEKGELRASQGAADKLGLALEYFPLHKVEELDGVLAAVSRARCEAVDVFPDAITMRVREAIAAYSLRSRVPAVSGWARFADSGNLGSYGPDLSDVYRQLSGYVDRVLKGASPAELPIGLPTKIEMVINQKVARSLGLVVPRSLLLRADRVIE